jgi:hypothetical protein
VFTDVGSIMELILLGTGVVPYTHKNDQKFPANCPFHLSFIRAAYRYCVLFYYLLKAE